MGVVAQVRQGYVRPEEGDNFSASKIVQSGTLQHLKLVLQPKRLFVRPTSCAMNVVGWAGALL